MSKNMMMCKSGGDAVYAMGLIGAAFYFVQHGETYTDKIVGILKAFIWPAIFTYQLLDFWKM